MAQRLFVFDMDGVLVPSEKVWMEMEPRTFQDLFGEAIGSKIGDTVGITVGQVYERAVSLGARMTKAEFHRRYNEVALRVYSRCTISAGANELVDYLLSHTWRIALLSASPALWIEQVLEKLPWRKKLSAALSLNEHPELRPKPAPDGYAYLAQTLRASPRSSVALEDSNPGIAAARAAGYFTIGYRQHLPHGYKQQGTDVTADTMTGVLTIVSRGTSRLQVLRMGKYAHGERTQKE